MIKINLASRKRAPGVDAREKATPLNFASLKNSINADLLKDPQVRKFILAIVIAVMGYFLLDGYKTEQIRKVDEEIAQVAAENAKLKIELDKSKGYEAVKKQLDADELVLTTKLTTIRKLIADRQVPPKLLLALSNGIPAQLWLSDFSMSLKDFNIKGFSVDYTQVTDFTKVLSENEFLTDLKLVGSKKVKDESGLDVVNFEVTAKRK